MNLITIIAIAVILVMLLASAIRVSKPAGK